MSCPWLKKHREHLSDGSCSLFPSDESQNLVHVHHDVQYSTDPETGRPLVFMLNSLDTCELSDFSLNRRLCSVSTEIDTTDIHVAAYKPRNAIEFWTVVRTVLRKWYSFHDETGYWPSFCTVADAVLDPKRLDAGEPGAWRSLRPVHFVKDCTSLSAAINRLLSAWFDNYYLYVLETYGDDDGSGETLEAGGCPVKARRIECDAKDHACGFWQLYNPDKYREAFSQEGAEDWSSVRCRLKHIMDKTAFARLRRETRRKSNGHRIGMASRSILYYDDDDNEDEVREEEEALADRPRASVNSERLRAKRLFHTIVVETFGNHRDYPHTIMCKDFIVNDKRWCSMWLETVRKFCDYRLGRLRGSFDVGRDDEEDEESARSGIRQIVKEWNSFFPTLSESTRQRNREMVKLLRKKRKNDSITRELRTRENRSAES